MIQILAKLSRNKVSKTTKLSFRREKRWRNKTRSKINSNEDAAPECKFFTVSLLNQFSIHSLLSIKAAAGEAAGSRLV